MRRSEDGLLGPLWQVAALTVLMAWLGGCADRMVDLRYMPDPKIDRLPRADAVTVFRFTDIRGDEGDHGDPFRVGGIYNGYGMRYAKIMTPNPWPEALVQDLAAGFAQRGVPAVVVADHVYVPGVQVSTPFVLGGEIHNFSTEGRWLGLLAHVSGSIRLYDQVGAALLEKPISARVRWLPGVNIPEDRPVLEGLLNEAVAEFVRKAVTDPEVTQRLVGGR